MKELIRDMVKQAISEQREAVSEQNSKRSIIDTSSRTYIMVYDNSYLLNNLLTRIRVLEGVSTVYQRDAIKKVGNTSKVPVEISYLAIEGTGGDSAFLEELLKKVRSVKGITRLEKTVSSS